MGWNAMSTKAAKPRKPATVADAPCIVCGARIVGPEAVRAAVPVSGHLAHPQCWERAQREIAARADAMPAFQTVCEGCGNWVPRIMHHTLDGKRLCEACAPKESTVAVVDATLLKPAEAVDCWCGLPAVRRCQCGEALCDFHWNRHGHKVSIR